jgi:elongation factor G
MSGLEFPSAIYTRAVFPKTKSDIDKLTSSLARITEEDPSVTVAREKDTSEIIMSGLGDTHLEVCAEKMERKFGLRVDLERPRVPYRETISTPTSAEFKHKKQSGGAGQYGHVILELQPLSNGDGFEFESRVVGGSVPREYIPSVEKGIRAALATGTVGGFPVTDLKATLVDGSFHSVDSSGVSFEIAAGRALSVGMERAQPVLLEPVMKVVVKVPDEYTGDIIGDLNSRRGRISGMASAEEGYSSTEADVPHAEMLDYATTLRSLTQGLGTFSMEFSRYEETPKHLVDIAVTDNEELVEKAGSRN